MGYENVTTSGAAQGPEQGLDRKQVLLGVDALLVHHVGLGVAEFDDPADIFVELVVAQVLFVLGVDC